MILLQIFFHFHLDPYLLLVKYNDIKERQIVKYQTLTNIIHLLQLFRKLVMYVLFEMDIKMKGIKGGGNVLTLKKIIFYKLFILQKKNKKNYEYYIKQT